MEWILLHEDGVTHTQTLNNGYGLSGIPWVDIYEAIVDRISRSH
jgi:hypothetical protein